MPVVYQAAFHYQREKDELSLTRILPDGSQDTNPLNLDDIRGMERQCADFRWNKSLNLSQEIGKKLFDLLNGDRQTLVRALNKAHDHGETLHVYVRPVGPTSNLPFELLYHSVFLVASEIHLVRRVSDWGCRRSPQPKNHPLKILFMACSPAPISPVLKFEKEEDTIYEVTKELPVEIDVEDTGSLEGLAERLARNEYDAVHLSGHADINEKGVPFFWMEDEEGLPVQVTPSQLWDKLNLSLPRLLFLSGCRTGETPPHVATSSFAHQLVAKHYSICLGWGLPVSDSGASFAAKQLYFELSRGENILKAVLSTRRELFKRQKTDWPLLRLFSDGTPLTIPLVRRGQRRRPKRRDLQYVYLHSTQVKVLKKGFVGRRRQIQQGLRSLRKDEEKVGLLLHGTGGLGKSCLAGKFCERFKDHDLIIVHGKLDALTLGEALKDAFVRAKDKGGLKVLDESEEMPDKLRSLCSSSFQENNYLILLDDFERSLVKIKEGEPQVSSDAVPLLEMLLRYLPYSDKMSQLIITSRYTFPLTFEGVNLVEQCLESIGLASFRGADEGKKLSELKHIPRYPDPDLRQKLIEAGRGNPRLMEDLDILVGEAQDLDVVSLLSAVKGKQDEFVQSLVLREILESQPGEFQTLMRWSAVYRLPVLKEGIRLVCERLPYWESYVDQAVRLSLLEQDSSRKNFVQYWVTPLLRDDIFREQGAEERKRCHQAAISYYEGVLSQSPGYEPIMSFELIEHALKAQMHELAIEEAGGRLLPYLRSSLAYKEALSYGEYILSQVPEPRRDDKLAKFLFELGWIYYDTGDAREAIKYYEQALSIDKEVYGERHPNIATRLNNLGSAWKDLGEAKKAIEYFEQALSIDKEVYGEKHPHVAATLNNLGLAWQDLGEAKKAIEYFEQALSIVREAYGEKHPHVAATLNNLGLAWQILGDAKKAIEYYEQALSIVREAYGEKHPHVATTLNNLGLAWKDLGDAKKAIEYFEQALSIVREVYGEKHSRVAATLNNLGGAWYALGDAKKAIRYFQGAYDIFREFYGDEHPDTKNAEKWLNSLRNKKKSKDCP